MYNLLLQYYLSNHAVHPCSLFTDFYSVMSEGSASDSDADNESQGADVETDEEDGIYFDTSDFLSSESLRSGSYRSRDSMGNNCFYLPYGRDSTSSDVMHGNSVGVKIPEYPFVKRRKKLPEPKEKEKPVGLWSIIKENIGKDLSGVCLPVYFNEPLSSLQKCFEDLEYSYLVDRALEWGKQVSVSKPQETLQFNNCHSAYYLASLNLKTYMKLDISFFSFTTKYYATFFLFQVAIFCLLFWLSNSNNLDSARAAN